MTKESMAEKAATLDKVREQNRQRVAKHRAKLEQEGMVKKTVLLPKIVARVVSVNEKEYFIEQDYEAVGIYTQYKKQYERKLRNENLVPFLEEKLFKIVNEKGEIEEQKLFYLDFVKKSDTFTQERMEEVFSNHDFAINEDEQEETNKPRP